MNTRYAENSVLGIAVPADKPIPPSRLGSALSDLVRACDIAEDAGSRAEKIRTALLGSGLTAPETLGKIPVPGAGTEAVMAQIDLGLKRLHNALQCIHNELQRLESL